MNVDNHSRLHLRNRLPGRYINRLSVPLVMLPAAGGIALVVHILTGFSLPIGLGAVAAAGLAVWILVYSRAGLASKALLVRRLRIGLIAGLAATLVYDLLRYGIDALLTWSLDPFHAWSLFGGALLGVEPSGPAVFAVGFAYHLLNGLGFAVAFVLMAKKPSIYLGAAWGLALELAMALLYPSWMVIAQLGEFLTISVLGHLGYGATLGFLAQRMLATSAPADSAAAADREVLR